MRRTLFVVAFVCLLAGCSDTYSYSYEWHGSTDRNGHYTSRSSSATNRNGYYTNRSSSTTNAPTNRDGYYTSRSSSPTTESSDLTPEQKRALDNIVGITLTTAVASYTSDSVNILGQGVHVYSKIKRAEYISDFIKQAFPELTEFGNRTVTRLAGLVIDGRLSAENMTEQTIRGEAVAALSREGPDAAQAAKIANFLYLLSQKQIQTARN